MTTLAGRLHRRKIYQRTARLAIAAALGAGLLILASCGPDFDPLTREGLWEPNHVNRTNLSLEVADPSDLVRGKGTAASDGMLAAAAIDRLRNDKVKKLPAADISQLSVGQAGSNNATTGAQ